MTHDFAKPSTTRKPAATKKKATKTPPKSNTTPAPHHKPGRIRVALSLLVLLGIFIGGLYMLQSVPPTATPAITESKAVETKPAPPISKPKEKTEQTVQDTNPRFKFYDILPQSEVETKDIDAYHFKEKTREKPYYYMIQTGSFRSPEDAERQKATIAFQGLKARIDVIQTAQGSTWHRVSTGPFHDRSQMNSAMDKLVALNIAPLVKKIETDK